MLSVFTLCVSTRIKLESFLLLKKVKGNPLHSAGWHPAYEPGWVVSGDAQQLPADGFPAWETDNPDKAVGTYPLASSKRQLIQDPIEFCTTNLANIIISQSIPGRVQPLKGSATFSICLTK